MRRQPHPVANITGGIDTSQDPVFLLDTSAANMRGVRIEKGMLKKDFVFNQQLGSNLANQVMWIDTFIDANGAEQVLAGDFGDVYLYNGANNTFDALSANLTGSANYPFDSTQTIDANGADVLVMTNGKDPIVKWDGANLANLGGLANTTAQYLAPFWSRLVIAGVTANGTLDHRRVQWSAIGDIEDYTLANGANFVELVDTEDWITGLKLMWGRLFVLKEKSIWELVYVGSSKTFEPVLIVDGVGTYCSKTMVARRGGVAPLLGTTGIYLFDGTPNLQSIDKAIRPMVFETPSRIVNHEFIERSCARYIEELDEYWLAVPANSSPVPNLLLKYSFGHDAWLPKDQVATALSDYKGTASPLAWAQLAGNWANAFGSNLWVDPTVPSGVPFTLIGSNNGAVYRDTRANTGNETMTFQTKAWTFGRSQRVVELRGQFKYGPFTLSYSLDEGATFIGDTVFANQANFSEFSLPLNVTTQHLVARIVTTANEFELKWLEPWYISRARSKSVVTS